jgi:hypothetical protein
MKHVLLTLILAFSASHSASQVGTIPKIIHGANSASDASKTSRAGRVGSKALAGESAAIATRGSENIVNNETRALIATRTAQVIGNCKSSPGPKSKELECKKRSDEFHRCIASEMEFTVTAKTAIDRCTKLYN